MNKYDAEENLKYLEVLAEKLGVLDVAKIVLDNNRFFRCSGSHGEEYHHYGDYGLITHVSEVVETCMAIYDLYPQYHDDMDKIVLFLAALFHDAGKMYDLRRVVPNPNIESEWEGTLHKREIHHIPRSFLIWNNALDDYEKNRDKNTQDSYEYLRDKVGHAILAHHGRREWGSPVSPHTGEAWILHLADSVSARLYDYQTLDRLS
jgi:3'-5' exoribonuclease